MSGSPGDGEGIVHLAHAWVPDSCREHTTGSWHWWNVYKDYATATSQAARVASSRWCEHARTEVRTIVGASTRCTVTDDALRRTT